MGDPRDPPDPTPPTPPEPRPDEVRKERFTWKEGDVEIISTPDDNA